MALPLLPIALGALGLGVTTWGAKGIMKSIYDTKFVNEIRKDNKDCYKDLAKLKEDKGRRWASLQGDFQKEYGKLYDKMNDCHREILKGKKHKDLTKKCRPPKN